MASHIWRARTVRESKKPGKHTWRARHEKKKTPRCIYYDCHAPGNRVITGLIPAFQEWLSDEIETTRQTFFTLSPPAILSSRSRFSFLSFNFCTDIAEIRSRIFFFSFFFFLESQPWQFHYFSPPFCCPEDFSSIFQENAWRSFSSLKFCFSSRKGFPFHLSFSFFSFLKISRVIFSKHRLQNFSRLFEKSTFFVYTRLDHPLPRLFNPPLLHFLTSNFLPDNSLEQRSSFISAIINFRDSFSPSYLRNDSIREIYLEIFGKSPFSFEEEIWEASARGVAELESRLVG